MPPCVPTHSTWSLCATRRYVSGGGRETRLAGLSQQSGEAEGSLTEEVLGRVGSSPDNDGTGRHCQTTRVRQARQRGVTRVNQWLNPLKCGTSSNLVDMGWAAACVDSIDEKATPTSVIDADQEVTMKCLRRSRDKAAGAKLGADPVNRHMVNVGTIPGPSHPLCSQHEGGQVHRRLVTPGWGGGSVVVRGRESRLHGEGTQRIRSRSSGMPGGRR